MSPAEYGRRRAALLQSAAWNGYVARRGMNAAEGQRRRKENQQHMRSLREARKVVVA